MATGGRTRGISELADRPALFEKGRHIEQGAGYLLLLGGAAFAASYVVVGSTQLEPWAALLAIAGSALVLFGIRSSFHRSA